MVRFGCSALAGLALTLGLASGLAVPEELAGPENVSAPQELGPEATTLLSGGGLLGFGRPGVKVSFREIHICETTPGVKSYAGYITLPLTSSLTNLPYNASIFFWFFESRDVSPWTAPLTVWLQGGPGLASMTQAVGGHNGPCIVQSNSNSTVLNPFSWNKVSNMLYIDQPVQTGFSYDDLPVDGIMDMLTGDIAVGGGPGPSNFTSRRGKFASQDPTKTAITTAGAAKVVVEFLDVWFDHFGLKYKRSGINLWSQSYGGHFAPAIASIIQNTRFPAWPKLRVKVDSVGIINGIIDTLVQTPSYPDFAVNNTYGIQAIPVAAAETAKANMTTCAFLTNICRGLQNQYDPLNTGLNATINAACLDAFGYCITFVAGPYDALSGRNPFDIGHTIPDNFPPPYALGYLNNAWVRQALNVPVNFTDKSSVVLNNFIAFGDFPRSYLPELTSLLNAGVKVALLHGDRDYRANWFGGELLSLALTHTTSPSFHAAGYTPLRTTPTAPIAGQTRQHANLSFSRIYQAGHEAAYYRPEAVYAVFARTLRGRDAATGLVNAGAGYSTTGPASVRGVSAGPVAPAQGPGECYVEWAPLGERCSAAQVGALVAGTAVVGGAGGRVVVSPAA